MTKKAREILDEILHIRRRIALRMRDIEQIQRIDDVFLSESDRYLINLYQDEIKLLNQDIIALEKEKSKKAVPKVPSKKKAQK